MSEPKEKSPLLSSRGYGNHSIQVPFHAIPHDNHDDNHGINNDDIGEEDDNHSVLITSSTAEEKVKLPLPRAIFVVTNAALGAGMLNFPQAYSKTGGVWQALVVQTCLIVLIIGAFQILGYCGQVSHSLTYQDTVKNFCGSTAQVTCQIIVVLYMFGSNVTYLILIGDQLTNVIDHSGWYFDRRFVITVISCTCILPLCLPEKLKAISYSSIFGGLGALYVCLMVVSNYYKGSYKPEEKDKVTNFHLSHVFAAVPVICFGFQCHVTSVAVYAELRQPTLQRFGIVTVCATAICTLIYSLTGVYGFLTFRHGVKSDILVNYDDKDAAANAGRAIIVVVVFSTYAICHFVGRSAFLGLWVKMRRLTTAEIETFKDKRRKITSLVWFFLSLALSIIVPTIGKAIAIVGGFAAHFIFTFPGLCLIHLILRGDMEMTNRNKLGLFIGAIYVVIGVFLFGETVTLAIMEDIEPKYAF